LEVFLFQHAPAGYRPVDKHSPALDVLFGHKAPVAAVIAVGAVISQHEVAVIRHLDRISCCPIGRVAYLPDVSNAFETSGSASIFPSMVT